MIFLRILGNQIYEPNLSPVDRPGVQPCSQCHSHRHRRCGLCLGLRLHAAAHGGAGLGGHWTTGLGTWERLVVHSWTATRSFKGNPPWRTRKMWPKCPKQWCCFKPVISEIRGVRYVLSSCILVWGATVEPQKQRKQSHSLAAIKESPKNGRGRKGICGAGRLWIAITNHYGRRPKVRNLYNLI